MDRWSSGPGSLSHSNPKGEFWRKKVKDGDGQPAIDGDGGGDGDGDGQPATDGDGDGDGDGE